MVRPHTIDFAIEKQKPWLVLINGLFVDKSSWDSHINLLNKDFNVLRYDCLGQNKTDQLPESYSLLEHVKDLKDLLDYLCIDRVYLLGLSNGGRIALKFAQTYPSYVDTVIAGATYDRLSTDLQLKLSSWLRASLAGGNRLRFEVSTPWIFGKSFIKSSAQVIKKFQKHNQNKDQRVAEFLIKNALRKEDTIEVDQIKCKTVLFAGKEDLLTPVDSHREMMNKFSQCPSFVELEGGHACILESPHGVKTIMENICPG